jgi:hypothetical protein
VTTERRQILEHRIKEWSEQKVILDRFIAESESELKQIMTDEWTELTDDYDEGEVLWILAPVAQKFTAMKTHKGTWWLSGRSYGARENTWKELLAFVNGQSSGAAIYWASEWEQIK